MFTEKHERKAVVSHLVGFVFSGFMTKLYAAALAVWIATEVYGFISHVFTPVTTAMGG